MWRATMSVSIEKKPGCLLYAVEPSYGSCAFFRCGAGSASGMLTLVLGKGLPVQTVAVQSPEGAAYRSLGQRPRLVPAVVVRSPEGAT